MVIVTMNHTSVNPESAKLVEYSKIISVNVQGLNNHEKRRKLFRWFIVELEGVPGYPSTRESYVRFAGRSPICWTPKGLPRAQFSRLAHEMALSSY